MTSSSSAAAVALNTLFFPNGEKFIISMEKRLASARQMESFSKGTAERDSGLPAERTSNGEELGVSFSGDDALLPNGVDKPTDKGADGPPKNIPDGGLAPWGRGIENGN